MRFLGVATALVLMTASAHADLMSHALDETPSGGTPPQNNLLTWAGPLQQTSLPELLQVTVRVTPALQAAKLDIEIAEAQIQQTWARHDWILDAETRGGLSGSGVSG